MAEVITLGALLPALHDVNAPEDFASVNATKAISPDRVLARPWSEGRLHEARQRLAQGDRAEPIEVVRYRIDRNVWYIPSDGTHRALAAREAGLEHIHAHIRGEAICRPEQYVLFERFGVPTLWRRRSSETVRFVMELESDWMGVALGLGVQDQRGNPSWILP